MRDQSSTLQWNLSRTSKTSSTRPSSYTVRGKLMGVRQIRGRVPSPRGFFAGLVASFIVRLRPHRPFSIAAQRKKHKPHHRARDDGLCAQSRKRRKKCELTRHLYRTSLRLLSPGCPGCAIHTTHYPRRRCHLQWRRTKAPRASNS